MKNLLPKHIHPSHVVRKGWKIMPSLDALVRNVMLGKPDPSTYIVHKVAAPYLTVDCAGELIVVHARKLGYHISRSGIVYC